MKHAILFAGLLAASRTGLAQSADPTAETIMARVAANQDRADAERAHYLYVQHARFASRRGHTLQCEEITDTRVLPQPEGSTKTLLALHGRILKNGTYVTYDRLPDRAHRDEEHEDGPKEQADSSETDRDLVENLRKNLTDDKSQNGLHAGLFPLSSKAQSEYSFSLKGRERRNGVDTFHIRFKPRKQEDYGWRGDAWIDAEAYQPLLVQTALSRNIPFAVRMLLGTSLPGLGFSATYAAQPGGLWFPVSFGSEFRINVLFFFHRTITIAVDNRDFQKTHVESRIVPSPEGESAK